MTTQPATEPLPSTPFRLPRITLGMLLGVDDFSTMLGYPRGKHLLHQAWLHGPGVLWGYPVTLSGQKITVGPGLAIDAGGQDLPLGEQRSVDIADWLEQQGRVLRPGDEFQLQVVASAAHTGSDPVPVVTGSPVLADVLDPSFAADSRYVEGVGIDLIEAPPAEAAPFHRVRVLLGLEKPGPGLSDPDGAEAADAARRIARLSAAARPAALRAAFRDFAGRDAMARRPGADGIFPGEAAGCGVVLAGLTVKAGSGGTPTLRELDFSVRPVQVPTGVLQELICGLGPALGPGGLSGGGERGPRLAPKTLHWSDEQTFTVRSIGALRGGSVTGQTVRVASCGADGAWLVEDIHSVTYHDSDEGHVITVRLHQPPRHELIRIVVRGTGPTPVLGVSGLPLGGVHGNPPGSATDGQDAVLQIERPRHD